MLMSTNKSMPFHKVRKNVLTAEIEFLVYAMILIYPNLSPVELCCLKVMKILVFGSQACHLLTRTGM